MVGSGRVGGGVLLLVATLQHMVVAYLAGSMAMLLVDFPNHLIATLAITAPGRLPID